MLEFVQNNIKYPALLHKSIPISVVVNPAAIGELRPCWLFTHFTTRLDCSQTNTLMNRVKVAMTGASQGIRIPRWMLNDEEEYTGYEGCTNNKQGGTYFAVSSGLLAIVWLMMIINTKQAKEEKLICFLKTIKAYSLKQYTQEQYEKWCKDEVIDVLFGGCTEEFERMYCKFMYRLARTCTESIRMNYKKLKLMCEMEQARYKENMADKAAIGWPLRSHGIPVLIDKKTGKKLQLKIPQLDDAAPDPILEIYGDILYNTDKLCFTIFGLCALFTLFTLLPL